jgi:hypothetical protein
VDVNDYSLHAIDTNNFEQSQSNVMFMQVNPVLVVTAAPVIVISLFKVWILAEQSEKTNETF